MSAKELVHTKKTLSTNPVDPDNQCPSLYSPRHFYAVPSTCSASLFTTAGHICVFVYELPKPEHNNIHIIGRSFSEVLWFDKLVIQL